MDIEYVRFLLTEERVYYRKTAAEANRCLAKDTDTKEEAMWADESRRAQRRVDALDYVLSLIATN